MDKVGGITPVRPGKVADKAQVRPDHKFGDVLAGKMQELRFSAHAARRLSPADMAKEQRDLLASAVDKAAAKGCRESVVLMDQVAFVVSVKNRTVITAVPDWRMSEQIFTNIDSAVIVPMGAGPR